MMSIFDEMFELEYDERLKSLVLCSECGKNNSHENIYCIHCGHKLKKIPMKSKLYKKYCSCCGKPLNKDDDFCGYCGNELTKTIERVKVCSVCGEWCNDEQYCWNCGHDNFKNINIFGFLCSKKCPNCNTKYDKCFSYCDECGTKLIKK